MRVGNIVQNKHEESVYGTVEYSTFGFSIHTWKEYEGQPCLCKTLGAPASELLEHWRVVPRIPRGYKRNEYGGIVPK